MAIGELLLSKGIISEAQLNKVLHQQKIAGGRLGDNLVALGYISRGELKPSCKNRRRLQRPSQPPAWIRISSSTAC